MIKLVSHNQNISLETLENDKYFCSLLQFGLIDLYYSLSYSKTYILFFYLLPISQLKNFRSNFTRIVDKIILTIESFEIYTYSERRSVNLDSIFASDIKRKNYFDYTFKEAEKYQQDPSKYPNIHTKNFTPAKYRYPRITEELLFTIGYSTHLIVELSDLDSDPEDLLSLFALNPFACVFSLKKYRKIGEKSDTINLIAILSLNRFVVHFYEHLYRMIAEKYPQNLTHYHFIVNYPAYSPNSNIVKMIHETKEVYASGSHQLIENLLTCPVFHYRMRKEAFPLEFRLNAWKQFKRKYAETHFSYPKWKQFTKKLSETENYKESLRVLDL